jgi:LmbE family N-acetylglucosaminyl deacetylase
MPRRASRMLFPPLLVLIALAVPAHAQLDPLPYDQGAVGLGLALRRLPTTARVLYVTAHPDDEHNGVLVRLSRGLGVRTALLTVTRGDGGQNAIGPELFEALGVLRTEELAAIHRYDAVEQYFGRAYEFGFSFSVEETFEKWGHEDTLGDVVRVVRAFRPDVILTLPLEAPGGGQHHQAVGRLAREAFRAAADPTRFPEQARAGLRPWQARKVYQGGTGGFPEKIEGAPVRVPTGVLDPLLGMTWQELGSISRSLHRCQGAGQLKADPGPADGVYYLLDSEPRVTVTEADILDGIDASVGRWLAMAPGHESALPALRPDLQSLEASLAGARAAYDPSAPTRVIPALDQSLEQVRRTRARVRDSRLADDARAELVERLTDKETQLQAALALAQRFAFEVTVDDGEVVPGQTFTVTARVWNQGKSAAVVESLALSVPPNWAVERKGGEERQALASGASLDVRYAVTVARDARYSEPYWKRDPKRDRYDLAVPGDEALPWSPPEVTATLRYSAESVLTIVRRPAVFRYPGPFVGGEKQHVVQVVPALSVRVSPDIAVIPLARPRLQKEFRVLVANNRKDAVQGAARLLVPAGWSVAPREAPLCFRYEGEEIAVRFFVTPGAAVAEGETSLKAVVTVDGQEFKEGVQVVAYDHIQRRHLIRPAEALVLATDVRTAPAIKIGYVMGSGDAVADAIRQLGVPVNLLTADDLAYANLSEYSTIVIGTRAYETRNDLRSGHPRLMAYVEAGGNLVVQYNRAAFNWLTPPQRQGPGSEGVSADSPFAPYPASVTPNRITDEKAPLKLLVPGSPLFTSPNRIAPRDWEGWVQERGIQFLAARDPRYVELLAGSDPFPKNPGVQKGILVEARVGRGTWTYVGLGLFRQLPAGTPGAYRLLANLVSRPRGR